MANWWDNLVGNFAGEALAANEPMVGKYRDPVTGSFRKNAFVGLAPAERKEEAGAAVDYVNAARALIPPEEKLTWNRAIGNVLSAASVPVAYAQGNTQYGSAMTGNTLADQWNTRQDKNTDARRKAEYELGAGLLSSESDASSKFYANRRTKREEAVRLVAGSIISAPADLKAAAIAKAKEYLNGLGYKAEADSIESGFAGSASARPAAPVAPAATGAPSTTNPMPGIVVDGGAPTAPSVDPASAAGGQPQTPAAPNAATYFSPKRKEAQLIEPYNPERAKQLNDEAEAEEAPYRAAAKKSAETLAEGNAKSLNQKKTAEDQANKVGELFDLLGDYGETPGVDYYTGALDSSAIAPYTTDILAKIAPYNQASPAIRDQIKGTQMALVALLKKNIRVEGEGSQDQREFQAVIDTVGDMSNANTVAEYWQKLADSKKRVEALTGVKIPTSNKRLSAENLETVDAPAPGATDEPAARVPAATAQVGETRMKQGVPYVKTAEGWVPQRQSVPAQTALDEARANLARRGR